MGSSTISRRIVPPRCEMRQGLVVLPNLVLL
jgi:hypothetical protein